MKRKIFAASILFWLICACVGSDHKSEVQAWSGRMQDLSQILSQLLPSVFSREEFHDPKNFAAIEKNTKRLSELAHAVKDQSGSGVIDKDPAVQYLAKNFEADITKAYDGLHTGNLEYSRQVLTAVTNHCITCHSRANIGPQFEKLNLNIDFAKLNPLVRPDLYAATRQFNLALSSYRDVVLNKEYVVSFPFEVEKALKKALALQVRVFNDPKRSIDFLEDFLKQPDLPHFLNRSARLWLTDLMAWKKEGSKKQPYKQNLERLINSAQGGSSSTEHDEFIKYLRATALGHEFLSKFKSDDKSYPHVLYYMGICYEFLQDLGYWTLGEDYFKECIKVSPHSDLSVRCYNRLEQSVYLGYTGSAGTKIPADVRGQLRELRDLAATTK